MKMNITSASTLSLLLSSDDSKRTKRTRVDTDDDDNIDFIGCDGTGL